MDNTTNRPQSTDEQTGKESIERISKSATNGLAGKINSAKFHAPEDAITIQIITVAQQAFDRGVHVTEIWNKEGLK